ncbi:MAG TPA: mismatch-specific DNA-glycosylase [Vicinamibacterales bacterium]|jgi:TDG/mug DNA glycosylase family protein
MRAILPKRPQPDFAALRLKDCVKPPVRVLFVGINPGVRSALTGHHFAGFSNRFWTLLFESGLVPERLRAEDDRRLPEWGYGVTNLVARPSPGIDTLAREEYQAGVGVLCRKIKRWQPEVVAFVGVTLYRAIFDVRGAVKLGLQPERIEGARVFVLPNPSGRNANYSYREMLTAFTSLRRLINRL